MHKNNVIHRDLKFENILFESTDKHDFGVKIVDFGLSKRYDPARPHLKGKFGTLYSMAPQVLRGSSYTIQADMWSVGVIAYGLLCGSFPFGHYIDSRTIVHRILHCKYRFDSPLTWIKVSDNAKYFVKSLLVYCPDERLTAKQALQSSWIIVSSSRIKVLDQHFFDRILASFEIFSAYGKLKKISISVIAHLSIGDIQSLREAFYAFDYDNEGVIDFQHFKLVLETAFLYSEKEIGALFIALDFKDCGFFILHRFSFRDPCNSRDD